MENDKSNNQVAVADDRPKVPSIAAQLKDKESNFKAALPAHIPVERFIRVVMTAVQNTPALAQANRQSLFNACMKAAQDGLLPDGRDGALVIYSSKVNGEWVKTVAWMPMVGGIRKKVRNSGEIATWDVHAVYARDHFDYEEGDNAHILHRPCLDGDPGPMIAVYSIATLKTGEKSRDVMTRAQVEYVRDTYSKKDFKGNFSPAWVKSFEEMAKKTVARRHSKTLPMSSDLDDLMRRDDELYDVAGASDKALAPQGGKIVSLNDRLSTLADSVAIDEETGEILDQEATGEDAPPHESGEADAPAAPASTQRPPAASKASPQGDKGDGAKAPPPQKAPSPEQRATAKPSNDALDADIIRKELLRDAKAAAEAGPDDLRDFLENLTPDQDAMISPAQIKKLRAIADAAANGGE